MSITKILRWQAEAEHAKPPLCSASFEFYAPSAHKVFVVGEFNDWDAKVTPMRRGDDGSWRVELMLPPGFYRYKFVVDSIWRCSPDQPRDRCDRPGHRCSRCVANAHGSFDRVAVVA
jgi:1,4-alpha-glucan branching enzyme